MWCHYFFSFNELKKILNLFSRKTTSVLDLWAIDFYF